MENTTRLRQYLGESGNLVTARAAHGRKRYLLDFTKSKRGEEITLIEVGEHGITIEFVHSGHKSMLTFNEVDFREGPLTESPAHRKLLHHTRTSH